MDFKGFYFKLSVAERDSFAQRAGTSRGLLTQVAYRNKEIELGLADVLVALSGGGVGLDDLPLTGNAKRQRGIREAKHRSPVKGDGEDGDKTPTPTPTPTLKLTAGAA